MASSKQGTMKIQTSFWLKPIPDRNHDWMAVDDDTYEPGCPCGSGATEQEAIDDLLTQIAERD